MRVAGGRYRQLELVKLRANGSQSNDFNGTLVRLTLVDESDGWI